MAKVKYKKAGICLHADYCNISNNICSSNRWNGIYLQNSNDNCISNNTCVKSDFGIYIEDSNYNNISNNNCSNNDAGIYLLDSNHNKLTGNVMVDNGLYISSYFMDSVFHTNEIDKSNTVNGKPVYYWKDIEGGRIPAGAGHTCQLHKYMY